MVRLGRPVAGALGLRMATQTLGGPGLGGPILGAMTLFDSFCLSFFEPHPYILDFSRSRSRSLLDSVEA